MSKYRHVFLPEGIARTHDFTTPSAGGGDSGVPPYPARPSRAEHAAAIQNGFQLAWNNSESEIADRSTRSLSTREGVYLQFELDADSELQFQSLEDLRSEIRLLSVRQSVNPAGQKTNMATVFFPKNKSDKFLNKLTKYADDDHPLSGKPWHEQLINTINEIKQAVYKEFWNLEDGDPPNDSDKQWCEIWLRTDKDTEITKQIESNLLLLLQLYDIRQKDGSLRFPERSIILVYANGSQLKELIASSDYIAEFRLAREATSFWCSLDNADQAGEWVSELAGRMQLQEGYSDVGVCILDTGVNNGHDLLSPAIHDDDCQTVFAEGGTYDHDGHGTAMAGLALFDDLEKSLEAVTPIPIEHCLESVKILPPNAENEPEHYGYITAQAIYLAEIAAPMRKRIVCMAITAENSLGYPNSWSAAIDALAAGVSIETLAPGTSVDSDGTQDDTYRLVIISAGNVTWDAENTLAYPEINRTSVVESPGQSWNALIVGAYTSKFKIEEDEYQSCEAIAPPDGLSPYSRTSVNWEQKLWPIRPDVVFEGGNVGRSEEGEYLSGLDDLSLLTTHYQPQLRQFDLIHGTSSATAKASWMAAQIQRRYPQAWPETIRGLLVHSAQWTNAMEQQFANSTKGDLKNLLRTCGYGVPSLNRAIETMNNSLTLVAQESIQPYDNPKEASSGESGGKTMQAHFYDLPWPKSELQQLGEATVEMRVTLSYFIEPGPGEIGWSYRYRYPSHGFRFGLNMPHEDESVFINA